MSQPKMTTHGNDPWMADYKELCKCGKGTVQQYFCNIETCEDNKTQKLYCIECVLEDGKHFKAHEKQKRVTIKDEAFRILAGWTATTTQYKDLNKIISTNYPPIKHLVSYLDEEALLNPKNL